MAQFNSYIDSLDLSAVIDFCRENGKLCHYKKGDYFVQQGSIARYAALVVSGYFKLATLNESGDEAVFNFAFPGNSLRISIRLYTELPPNSQLSRCRLQDNASAVTDVQGFSFPFSDRRI